MKLEMWRESLRREEARRPAVKVTTYDPNTVSGFCEIGPTAAHHRCSATWCQCPCHDTWEHGLYGGMI